MQHITILTPDNIEINYRLAGAGSRAAAAVADIAAQSLLYTIYALSVVYIFFGGFRAFSIDLNNLGWGAFLLIAGFFIIACVYYIAAEMFLDGRTIGKMIFGLRVIRENGAPITFVHSLIRNVFKLTIDFPGVGLILVMFTKKCKRVGDMVASTIVVSEDGRYKRTVKNYGLHVINPVFDLTLNEQYPELTRKEAALVKDYFIRRDSFSDKGRSVKTALAVFISRKYGVPEVKIDDGFLLNIIKK